MVHCRKRKGQWFSHVKKGSWKSPGSGLSNFRPHEERLARRICGHHTLFVLRLNHKGLHQTFSCIVAWDLTDTVRAFEADSFEAFLPMAAERYHFLYSNSSTWALEFDTTAVRACLRIYELVKAVLESSFRPGRDFLALCSNSWISGFCAPRRRGGYRPGGDAVTTPTHSTRGSRGGSW